MRSTAQNMHPSIMSEQHPVAGGRRRGLVHNNSNSSNHSQDNPYLPHNPRRKPIRHRVSITDPYHPNGYREQLHQPIERMFQRCRSDPPSLALASVALDDIAPPGSRRQSRWESTSKKATTTGMSMPTRRRGESPSNDTDAPRLSLKSSAIHHKLDHCSTQTQKSPSILLANASDDDDDDHFFVRRSRSNKGLIFQRDDSQGDVYKKKSTSNNNAKTTNKPTSVARFRRRHTRQVVDNQRLFQARDKDNGNDKEENDDDSLGHLVRALDQSEDQGPIFLSARHLLSPFASEESDDE